MIYIYTHVFVVNRKYILKDGDFEENTKHKMKCKRTKWRERPVFSVITVF